MKLQERLRELYVSTGVNYVQEAANALDAQEARIRALDDEVNRLRVRCYSQRIKIAELESKLAANFCAYADAHKAASGRIKELDSILRDWMEHIGSHEQKTRGITPQDAALWAIEKRAREALKP